MTCTCAPDSSSPRIFPSPTRPAPITRQFLPSSLRKIGNRGAAFKKSTFQSMRNGSGRRVAFHWECRFTSQKIAQLGVGVALKEMAQIFSRNAILAELQQQPLDRSGNFKRGAAIADGARDGGECSERTSDAEVVGVDRLAVDLELLAFDPEVGNPVLAATVGAPGHVKFEVLIEAGQSLIEFFDQPARKTFRFGDRELAELGAGAGYY